MKFFASPDAFRGQHGHVRRVAVDDLVLREAGGQRLGPLSSLLDHLDPDAWPSSPDHGLARRAAARDHDQAEAARVAAHEALELVDRAGGADDQRVVADLRAVGARRYDDFAFGDEGEYEAVLRQAGLGEGSFGEDRARFDRGTADLEGSAGVVLDLERVVAEQLVEDLCRCC